MRFRTLLIIVVALVALLAVVSFYVNNAWVLEGRLRLWGTTTISVGFGLLLAAAIGMLVVFAVGVSHEASTMIERARLRKAGRKSEEIEEDYSRGLVAVLEGREDEALGHFRAVLERDSRHFNTLIKIGEVLRGQGKHAEAIEYHRKAHHLNEESTRPLYALVEDHEAKGDLERALTVLGKIIGIDKQSVTAWRKLRALHVKHERWDPALEAQQRVEKLAQSRRDRDAVDAQYSVGIRYEIAVGLARDRKPREATGMLGKLLKENPRFVPAYATLGRVQLQEGRDSNAVQTWRRGFEATGSPVFLALIEEHHLAREEPLQAIEALKRAVREAPDEVLPRFCLGKLFFRLEMLDDAMSVLSSIEARAKGAKTLHYLLGRIHERRGSFREAARAYRTVIRETDPVRFEYRCSTCSAASTDWLARCPACRQWNTVDVDFREELPAAGVEPHPPQIRPDVPSGV